MFPKTKNFPSAKEFNAIEYLKFVASDDSFDKEDLKLLKKGAFILKEKFSYKFDLSFDEKEKILRSFEKNDIGAKWLERVLNYTLEALFSDPIYHGNENEIGWKSFRFTPGIPRPKICFGKKYV